MSEHRKRLETMCVSSGHGSWGMHEQNRESIRWALAEIDRLDLLARGWHADLDGANKDRKEYRAEIERLTTELQECQGNLDRCGDYLRQEQENNDDACKHMKSLRIEFEAMTAQRDLADQQRKAIPRNDKAMFDECRKEVKSLREALNVELSIKQDAGDILGRSMAQTDEALRQRNEAKAELAAERAKPKVIDPGMPRRFRFHKCAITGIGQKFGLYVPYRGLVIAEDGSRFKGTPDESDFEGFEWIDPEPKDTTVATP